MKPDYRQTVLAYKDTVYSAAAVRTLRTYFRTCS